MRVVNVDYSRNGHQPKRMGQYGPYQTTFTVPREAAFRIIDENGFYNVNAGKKFPYTITNIVTADGIPLGLAPIQSTALSGEDSVVRVQIPITQGQGQLSIGDQPVDAVLSLYGINGNIQYPIFENRKIRFTVTPASAFPLNLQAIYEKYDADKYAAETAAQDEIMAQKYSQMIASEAQAKAAADKAKAAADAAAAQKQAADDAIAAATNEPASRNKMIWTVGGIAALGLLSYLAFVD